MTHIKQAYDAACYYDGKLLGRCTVADSEAYSLLMKECGGEAVRVLREYPYLSPELKAILEKAALMQADRQRTGGMFHEPESSPWGKVQTCDTLCRFVYHYSASWNLFTNSRKTPCIDSRILYNLDSGNPSTESGDAPTNTMR